MQAHSDLFIIQWTTRQTTLLHTSGQRRLICKLFSLFLFFLLCTVLMIVCPIGKIYQVEYSSYICKSVIAVNHRLTYILCGGTQSIEKPSRLVLCDKILYYIQIRILCDKILYYIQIKKRVLIASAVSEVAYLQSRNYSTGIMLSNTCIYKFR